MIDTSPAIEQTNPANEDVKLDNHLLHFNFLPPNCTKSFEIFPGSIKKGFSIFFSSYLHSSMVYPPLINKENNTHNATGLVISKNLYIFCLFY
jgi:hypothetical protein